MPSPLGVSMLAMQHQLEASQWWAPDILRRQQFRQLEAVLEHAWESIPFYRDRLQAGGWSPGVPISDEVWARLPLLDRADVQAEEGARLASRNIPPTHGQALVGHTSGSTGRPIRFLGTEVTLFFWAAITLRDHLWQGRDLAGSFAMIRASVDDQDQPSWGAVVDAAYETGPSGTLNIRHGLDEQLDWLRARQPTFIVTHPSNAEGLARLSLQRGIALDGLAEVCTFGEVLDPRVREIVERAWGVHVTDVYSAEETGYLALQCPDSEHYHVQAENVLLEVLDDEGRPCAPGEIGRVVVSTLHNFAMPLIRYGIGDYAEAGEPCRCGRGLPVLKRVLGRRRNLITLPDGRRHWPFLGIREWAYDLPVERYQLVQHTPDRLELRLVAQRRLTAAEEARIAEVLARTLGHAFRVEFSYHRAFPAAPNHKFEDVVSLLDG